MNLIKYLKNKEKCPECHKPLIKTMDNEIYCSHCGLLVLDDYPNTNRLINYGISLENRKKYRNTDLKYIGTRNGTRRYL